MSELKHYGTLEKSGRFKWGEGDRPYQRLEKGGLLKAVRELEKEGYSQTEIAKILDLPTTTYRAKKSIALNEERKKNIALAIDLKNKGYSNVAAAERMGIPESTYRTLIAPDAELKADRLFATANMIEESFKDIPYIDIGSGAEQHMGITKTQLNTAVSLLEEKGYSVEKIYVTQLGTQKKTRMKVLVPPNTDYMDIINNRDKIDIIRKKSIDKGLSYPEKKPIQHVDSKRIFIRYAEEGGADKDGLIEVRPGVEDLDLGKNRYAQVRISVDGTHYMKGMAVRSMDIPEGYDAVYNVTKTKGTPPDKVFKKNEDDEQNPFGATIKIGGQRGALNIVNEEGDWRNWSKNLSSQMLSKQRDSLIKKQLDISLDRNQRELDEIMSLTNPTVKKKLLLEYADSLDYDTSHLQAAALPRQSNSVLLPFPDMSDKEIYAPNYRNGEKVALVRHPHGGIFEIPVLTVNNKHKRSKDILGTAPDAVGISPRVAERLSGADFDGDTVIVIPTDGKTIKTSSPLKGLQGFDPQTSYKLTEDRKKIYSKNKDGKIVTMDGKTKQQQMGIVSNLITDMTIKGATESELARAVRHSMVVIDAEKHELDWKQSSIDNKIGDLHKKYQGRTQGGASTLVSRARSDVYVNQRREGYSINPKTGEKIFFETGKTYINKDGKVVKNMTKTDKMSEVKDARELSSGTKVEDIYADYANHMKKMANVARKESVAVEAKGYSASAAVTYKEQVDSLNAKLNIALKNSPLERQAHIVAGYIEQEKKEANPNMDKATLKKVRGRAIQEARIRVGARKTPVDITDSEWEAIQAGAISPTKLNAILNNAKADQVRKLATPKDILTVTDQQTVRIKSMFTRGYTQADIADALGLSTSAISDVLSE